MKKTIFFLIFAIALGSCNRDNSSSSTYAHLLQRVDFYPGTISEKRWLFNADGLLKLITKANGTLVEKFTYDTNNNVIQNIKYENGLPVETNLITYNLSNKITVINGINYNYSASENRYYYSIGFNDYNCILNSDFLVIESHLIYNGTAEINHTDFYCEYILNNMISYNNLSIMVGEISTHYEFDNKINPLKNALLPVFRFKSLIDTEFFYGSFSSANNITSQYYFLTDSESHTYNYAYNSNNLPQIQTINNYSGGVFENSSVSAKYYYQGDALP